MQLELKSKDIQESVLQTLFEFTTFYIRNIKGIHNIYIERK